MIQNLFLCFASLVYTAQMFCRHRISLVFCSYSVFLYLGMVLLKVIMESIGMLYKQFSSFSSNGLVDIRLGDMVVETF